MAEATAVVEHEVRIDASPETVFAYFTDPARMVEWMGEAATLDPRPGGACRITIGAAVVAGRFEEVVPPSRVVFSWGWEEHYFSMPPGSTRVEVTLTAQGDGTLVRLAHSRLPDEGVEFHSNGWRHYTGRLAVAAAGGEPGEDDYPAVARGVAEGR